MFATFANWLFGCSHRRTSFPFTRRREQDLGTYVVCLECGVRIPYDWTQMRMAKQPVRADNKSIRAQREGRTRRVGWPTANRWFDRLVHHT